MSTQSRFPIKRECGTPTEDRKPARHRACLAYREMRQAGASDQVAHEAAVAAVQDVLPWRVPKPSTPSPMRPAITRSGSGRGLQTWREPQT